MLLWRLNDQYCTKSEHHTIFLHRVEGKTRGLKTRIPDSSASEEALLAVLAWVEVDLQTQAEEGLAWVEVVRHICRILAAKAVGPIKKEKNTC